MFKINIPGYKEFEFKHIVLDYNGTLAVDGELLPGVKERLNTLADDIEVHILTADTFGKVHSRMEGIKCRVSVLPPGNQDAGKLRYVRDLGVHHAVCIGNGLNDRLMLREAALGIAVILREGCATETLIAADVVCTDILSALEILQNPLRLAATLRK
ncbi:MAG TPA: ATPase P [Desulfobacteraceae bacterium]|nr:ATPase P [Desulfobacteraceae bacterium]